MNDVALRMESVFKMYRLGQVGTGTLSHDLNRWWSKVRGKDDPASTIAVVNDRTSNGDEYIWALQDINLDVKKGEIIGIIGRNGAGKSTLLKLLSRVTAPTKGEIRVNGRIASLLEVGTGFHPDLTGRENIFLNGAIMGMSRKEIRLKFDEIVEFAGCANYIDTPVKRYSSGMHVRLAFAVAAHLEPDILIVDEVLAVGDAEFQTKCLGKMQDVSNQSGRTVLFVSHNMAAVKRLCPNSILLENGTIVGSGTTAEIVDQYLAKGNSADRVIHWNVKESPATTDLILNSISVVDETNRTDSTLTSMSELRINIEYRLLNPLKNLRNVITIYSMDGTAIFSTSDYIIRQTEEHYVPGKYVSVCVIPGGFLTLGRYELILDMEIPMERGLLMGQSISFQIDELMVNQLGRILAPKPLGLIHPILNWSITKT